MRGNRRCEDKKSDWKKNVRKIRHKRKKIISTVRKTWLIESNIRPTANSSKTW